MSKNIFEKILKLSFSEKEYLNNNFEKISSILNLKIAEEAEVLNNEVSTDDNIISQISKIISGKAIFINGKKTTVNEAISHFNQTNDEDFGDLIIEAISDIPEVANLASTLQDTLYYYRDLIFSSISTTPEVPATEVPSKLQQELTKQDVNQADRDNFRKNFNIGADVDTQPLDTIGDFVLKTISSEFYMANSDFENAKMISSVNEMLRAKYLYYQDNGDETSILFYRDFERQYPEVMMKMYINKQTGQDINSIDVNSLDNQFQADWVQSIREYNTEYQEQMDAALKQRSSIDSGRGDKGVNYDKAALFCKKCTRFFPRGAIEGGVGGVYAGEKHKNEVCRTPEFGGGIVDDPESGERTVEGCQIVNNLLASRKGYEGGVTDLLAADTSLSIDLGEDFFGIKTGNFRFLGGKSDKETEQQELLVPKGYQNNINRNLVEFLNSAKQMEEEYGEVIFGFDDENPKQSIESLQNFTSKLQAFVESSSFFIPGFFGPNLGYKNKSMVFELSENPSNVDVDAYNITVDFKDAVGYLSEIFGRVGALKRGLSADTVGSHKDGTLKTEVVDLYDLWNMFSYYPNGAFLTQQGRSVPDYYRKTKEPLHYADSEIFPEEMETALAHPEVLSRSATVVNHLQDFVEKIMDREIEKAIKSGELERTPSAVGKRGEEYQRIKAKQKEIEGKKNILKAKIYDEYLRAKRIIMDVDVEYKNDKLTRKEDRELILPALNILDDEAFIAFVSSYIDMIGVGGKAIPRDPDNPKYWINPDVALNSYHKIIEMLGYDVVPDYVKEQAKEHKNEIETDYQDKFGEKIKEATIKIRQNSYPEYVEIINKILTLPKTLADHLTKDMFVEEVDIERVYSDNEGNPVFFVNNNGSEEIVIANYENKTFTKDGNVIDPNIVQYKKKDGYTTPVISGTVLANPKARQAIAMVSLFYSMRDKNDANPSKIYSLQGNATDGGILKHNNNGGAGIFAENDRRLAGASGYSDPFIIEFLKMSGATIAGYPVSKLYNRFDYMGVRDPRSESMKTEESRQNVHEVGDLVPKENKRGRKPKITSSNNWYKSVKTALYKNGDNNYNYVIITTKYDIRSVGRDRISNIDGKGKFNIPFVSIVPFSKFGSIEKVAEYSSDLNNPYLAIAVSEETENLMKEAGYWPLKDKSTGVKNV